MSNLLNTRIRIFSQAVTAYISAVTDAFATEPSDSGIFTMARYELVKAKLGGIETAADAVQRSALAFAEACEQINVECPLTHEVAFAPAWLMLNDGTGVWDWDRIKRLSFEMLEIRESQTPNDRGVSPIESTFPPGWMTMQEMKEAYTDVTPKEWDAIRNRLTRHNKRQEMPTGDASPPRYKYPADAVSEEVHIQRSKRPPNRPKKNN